MKVKLVQDTLPHADNIEIDRFPFVLGRHIECDHQLYHPMVSRKHCLIDWAGEEVIVADLASSNGTYVNGQPVHEATPVHDGDEISLACLSYRVRCADN